MVHLSLASGGDTVGKEAGMASTPNEAAPAAPAPAAPEPATPSPRRTVHRSFRLACGLGAAVAVGVILAVLGAMVSEQGRGTPHMPGIRRHSEKKGRDTVTLTPPRVDPGSHILDWPTSPAPVCACRGC